MVEHIISVGFPGGGGGWIAGFCRQFSVSSYFALERLKAQNGCMSSLAFPVGERVGNKIPVEDRFYDVTQSVMDDTISKV